MTNETNETSERHIESIGELIGDGDGWTAAPEGDAFAQSGIGNAPLYGERRGRVRMAVWTREDDSGTVRFSVSLTRTYKTEAGFRDTGSLDPRDLPDAIALLVSARALLPRRAKRKLAPDES